MALTKVSTGMLSADVASIDLNIDANTMYIDVSNNRVGINNATPSTALDVTGSVTADGLTVSSDSGGPVYLQDSNATATYNISELSNNAGNFGIQTRNSSGTFVSTDYQIVKNASGADYHRWFTQGTERLRLDASGNVGIGCTPTSNLQVLDEARVSSASNSAGKLALGDGGTGNDNIGIWRGAANSASDGNWLNLGAWGDSGITFSVGSAVFGSKTERMRIDSSGNVGIGTVPSAFNTLGGKSLVVGNGVNTSNLTLFSDDTADGNGYGNVAFADSNVSSSTAQYAGLIQYYHGEDSMRFYTNTTQKMRIDSNGNLLVGGTTASAKLIVDAGLSSGETIRGDNSQANYAGVNIYSVLLGSGTNNATARHFQGYAEGGTRFQVKGNGAVYGNGTYGTYSDLKLKENIVDANSQWADIKAVQLKNYSMKEDALSEANQLGVIAQDLEASGMQKLIEEMDDEDVDGNLLGTTTKHVKYSVLHLKALGALQEAMERIESLEARIAALES